MNIDRDLINRALQDAGQETLDDQAINEDVTAWRTCKSFYLPLLLEMLSTSEWTSHKKRKPLDVYEGENYSKYSNAYTLPTDCSKPIEVQENDEYIVEGNVLYTNTSGAILLYISNNRRTPVDRLPEIAEDGDRYLCNGLYYQYNAEIQDWEVIEEDYPEYDDIELSPEEAKCFENLLAAQIALKITGDPNLYQLLFGIAQNVKNEAIKQSRSQGVSCENGSRYWGEILGLSGEGDYEL